MSHTRATGLGLSLVLGVAAAAGGCLGNSSEEPGVVNQPNAVLCPGAPSWAEMVSYAKDSVVEYNGETYRCVQAHTSLQGWMPSVVPALWARTTDCGGAANRPTGSEIGVAWEVINNVVADDPDDWKAFTQELTLTNNSKLPLGNTGWKLYFNFVRSVHDDTVPASIKITHINGDLFSLEPTAEFKPLGPGESVAFRYDADNWAIKEVDAPAGYYIVFTDADEKASQPEVIENATVKPLLTSAQTGRFNGDKLPVPTTSSRFAENQALSLLPAAEVDPIVPSPVQIARAAGEFTLKASTVIHHGPGLKQEAEYLASALSSLLGSAPAVEEATTRGADVILLTKAPTVVVQSAAKSEGDEAYTLSVGPEGVEIVGTDAAGVFYGIQSLRALVPPSAHVAAQDSVTLSGWTVADAPSFKYRGMHLDVARNFQPKDSVKKLLDLMALYKLNKFHFHATDDEGWRLPIEALPELTEVGGKRGHTLDDSANLVPSFGSGPTTDSRGSGAYTREDFVEILKYATERHIEVIPAVDVPGHARAAVKAMLARHARLTAENETEKASEYLLNDLEDSSKWSSVQLWSDNVVNPCQESTYKFLKVVIDDIVSMYQEAGAPLTTVHTGGDEVPAGVWENSPACAAFIAQPGDAVESVKDLPRYFLERVQEIISAHSLHVGGWEEIGLTKATVDDQTVHVANPEFVNSQFRTYAWNNVWGWGDEANAYKMANAGYDVILSNATNLYFDLAYDKDPVEPGYYWAGFVDTRKPYEFTPLDLFKSAYQDRMGNDVAASSFDNETFYPRLTAEGKGHILGIQGQLWGENVKSQELLEHLAFPKLLGLAERAWAVDPSWAAIADKTERVSAIDKAWNRFANTLGQRELKRLDHLYGGVKYRISLPGAQVADGMLTANVAFPGLTIRYTTDGSEPTAESNEYTGPVAVSGEVKLKAFDTVGRSSRTAVVAAGN